MVLGPRVYSTGRAMLPGNIRIENLDDARASIGHYKRMGTNVVKQYTQPHRRQRQWVIQAVRELGMNATNEGAGDLRLDLTMVTDGYTGFEHALPVADLYNDVIRFIAESKTWYTPTLVVAYGGPTAEWYFYQNTNVHDDPRLNRFTPHEIVDRRTRRGDWNHPDEFHFPAVARGAARILQAGGNIALGAHGEEQGICAHWELWALQMGGLTNHQALRAATAMAVEGLGFQQDLGTLESGKLADLLVLDRSPLEDIKNSTSIRYVMKNGELFEAETLRQVWPVEKSAPVFTDVDFTRPPNRGN
jgi:imidazolonepropionase-like amidohydrolase